MGGRCRSCCRRCGGGSGCSGAGGTIRGGKGRREGAEGTRGEWVGATESDGVGCDGREVVGKDGSGKWRRRDEERRDLDFCSVHVRRAYYRVLLLVDPVERTERIRRNLSGHLRISVAHDRVPYFDGTTAFEYIYPYWAPVIERGQTDVRVGEHGLTRQRCAHHPQRVQKERRDQCPCRTPSASLSKSAAGGEITVHLRERS